MVISIYGTMSANILTYSEKRIWALPLLLFAFPDVSSVNAIWVQHPYKSEPIHLKDGDLVFRRGYSFVSHMVLAADHIGRYSHVGITITRNGSPFVIHASPDEVGDQPGIVREEPFLEFIAPSIASSYAVYRLKSASESLAREAALHASHYARAETPFDSGFDLDTPDRLYCTELVWRSYLAAGVDLAGLGFHQVKIPLFYKSVLLVSSLAGSEHLVRIEEVESTSGDIR